MRKIARAQGFNKLLSSHLARPDWGGGAFFYCEPAHALLIKENQHLLPFKFQSKHIIYSPQYEGILFECLGAQKYLEKGRGRYPVATYHVVELPGYPMLDLTQVSSTQIDPDLIDYLMAPSGMQSMVPEIWEDVWQTIIDEEKLFITTNGVKGNMSMECKICKDAGLAETMMSLSHICNSACQTIMSEKVTPNSIFSAMLECAGKSPPKVYFIGDRSHGCMQAVVMHEGSMHMPDTPLSAISV